MQRDVNQTVSCLGARVLWPKRARFCAAIRTSKTGLRRATKEGTSWAEITHAVALAWQQPRHELCATRGSGARDAAFYLSRACGLTLRELGTYAGAVQPNAVSIAIRRFTQRLTQDRAVSRKLVRAQNALKETY